MNKTLSALLVSASLITPAHADTLPNKEKTIDKITQVLGDSILEDIEQERHQAHIQKLIPEIKEPIILWNLREPEISITIDDWYGKESIEYMLNLFEKKGVKATFFVIWDCLKLYPTLWKRAIDQWHEICNHTMHHNKYFKTWNEPERFESELLWREQTVKDVFWEEYLVRMNFPFFRFPGMYWIREKAYLDILKDHGYIPIWWSNTKNPANGMVNNWDIFLWHFKNADTLNVRKNLEMVLQDGKQPKTVSDIITSEEYTEPIWRHNVYKKKNEVKK